ncbi:MAG: NAD/FAD-binding protein, partial [Hyphomicrobiales bacterium]
NDALAAQQALGNIQGENNTWFCGAWCGYGFHEDGLKAGLDVAEKLGATIPWRSAGNKRPPKLEAAE